MFRLICCELQLTGVQKTWLVRQNGSEFSTSFSTTTTCDNRQKHETTASVLGAILTASAFRRCSIISAVAIPDSISRLLWVFLPFNFCGPYAFVVLPMHLPLEVTGKLWTYIVFCFWNLLLNLCLLLWSGPSEGRKNRCFNQWFVRRVVRGKSSGSCLSPRIRFRPKWTGAKDVHDAHSSIKVNIFLISWLTFFNAKYFCLSEIFVYTQTISPPSAVAIFICVCF